jgi:hypothetical protein
MSFPLAARQYRWWRLRAASEIQGKGSNVPELLVDFITSLDGYAAAEGWPGWWGLQGPEYLAWLGERPEADYTILMGAATYRLMAARLRRVRPKLF